MLKPGTGWRKSTRSSSGACVEACPEGEEEVTDVLIRDSKDRTGPMLKVSRAMWTSFIGGVTRDEFGTA
jgi:hypothetical protein